MLVEPQCDRTGFSAGQGEPASPNTDQTAARNGDDSKPGDTKHVDSNGPRNEEDKGNVEDELDEKQNPSKTRNIPKKQTISVVFNYSKVTLTKSMENLLNRGFNFSILPLKLDLTQVLVDFKKFERSVIWHEYFYGEESDCDFCGKIFKSNKSNLPKNYKTPEALKTYLGR